MSVAFDSSPSVHFGTPKQLFEGRFERSYEVSKNGQRFLMIQPINTEPARLEAQVVMEWFEELKRLAPPSK